MLQTLQSSINNSNHVVIQGMQYSSIIRKLPIVDLPLKEKDSVLYTLIEQEKKRHFERIELIVSEKCISKAVMDCLGSPLYNKYSEGYPGKRYYGRNQVIDKIENLAIKRSLKAFSLNSSEWGVNV